MTGLTDRSEIFRSAIAAFIETRREAKLKGNENDADAASKYEYEAWLADAARRVGQIQAVTHVLKATHPDARGSSVHAAPSSLPRHAEIGTHSLGDDYAEDVVGNAAALDVLKFLRIEVDGRRLLHWIQASDADLRSALHPDADIASGWMGAFGALVRSDPAPMSHEASKQVYWLVGKEPANDAHYHLLQPLFSSSLAHAVHTDIQDARFGDISKLARQAFHAKEAYEGPYRDYRNLVVRKLGGTKPQNISQLNSERRGVNYLLASVPPVWTSEQPRSLLGLESALDRFTHFKGVLALVRTLADFLLSDPDKAIATRNERKAIVQALSVQLPLFAASIHTGAEPGWTRDPDCRLPLCEQLWLDPERTGLPPREGHEQEDEEFKTAYDRGDWPEEVAGRFANWVNAQLHKAGLTTVGDVEHKHWARQAIVDAAWPVPLRVRVGGEA